MSSQINVLAELQRNGIDYKFINAEEVGVKCPFHEDNSPSCHINLGKGQFICRATACNQSGDVIALLARFLKVTRKVVLADLGKRYQLNDEATIKASVIEGYHAKIWVAHPLLKALFDRGLTREDIRQYRLGEHQGRITIPVKNDAGMYVNIRSYLPGAPGADKMKNLKGRASKLRLYPYDQLGFNKIVITGGEIKAIALAARINQYGYGALCATAGEGNWAPYLTTEFVGKDTWVMMDIDAAGRTAAEMVNRHLNRHVISAHDVLLPLHIDQFPKGDINDWIATGIRPKDIVDLLESTAEWSPKVANALEPAAPKAMSLAQASHASITGIRLKVKATVTALDNSPYVIPKEVTVQCSREEQMCALCPVFVELEDKVYTVRDEAPAILEMVQKSKQNQQYVLQDELEIPSTCQSCRFTPLSFYNVEDVRLSPQLDISERSNEKSLQPAICIGDGLELNETYEFVGRMHPHPATQQATLMISAYKPTSDALSQYKCKDVEKLKLFRPNEWTLQGLTEKLDKLYEDFEANVTAIYQRRRVHLFCDLAYHSPLFIDFEGKRVKGWTEVLIIGDSSQGKSETVVNLQKHYNLGEKIECKNASVAGLLGGLQQMGTRWFVSWGLFPTHDRRLVILEELKGASTEVISKLTDMRSSGIAEIPKIEKRRTHARTRVIAVSNPRSNFAMDRYNFGVDAIRELIGSPEDLRRFDACLVVEKSEVDPTVVNELQQHKPQVPHLHTSELCRELVLWSWTVADIAFEEAAASEVLSRTMLMCDKYSESVPIVDRGSMRYKIARLSAALAARTYSADEKGTLLIVRKCHVEYICDMLNEVYDTPAFGYNYYSEAERMRNNLVDAEVIIKRINDTPYPSELVKSILHTNWIEQQDVMDWCSWDRQEASSFLSLLVRKRAVTRMKSAYVKTAPFITLLKKMEPVVRPPHVEEF